ncbi:hypothetical protein FRB95_004989 [Tulasnella sp. JGI-2019a]|nr:hypothetical protein FRB95_004989 [Tulasnella sp. JGI-2019a]
MSKVYLPTTLLYSAKVLGVTGAGLLTGFGVCLSACTTPGLLAADLPPAKLVQAWNEVFDHGAPIAIKTSLGTAITLFYSAYRSHRTISPPRLTILGLTEATQLALAGASVVGTFVFGMIFMMPTSIRRLRQKRAAIEEAKAKGSESLYIVDAAAVREDIIHWERLVSMRTTIFGAAFFLGLTSL